MAWEDEMLPILRCLINDIAEAAFSDDTLTSTLVVAAYQVVQQLTFPAEYTIKVSDQIISPDPTVDGSKDDAFINLVTQKAACIIDRGSAITAATQAIAVRDGSSAIDLRSVFAGKLELIKKGWCAVYQDTKLEYQTGNFGIAGAVVMSPFRSWRSADAPGMYVTVPGRERFPYGG